MASVAATALIWVLFILSSSAQRLSTGRTDHGLCKDIFCNTLEALEHLKGCVVVVGELKISVMETTNVGSFKNISFPELLEVTGFVVVYRVIGLESIGRLFPNLARIRGRQLIDNFGLIVHDMPNLKEVGLYNLLKIDRGGVVIWGGPHTCFVDTVDWNAIAPRSRLVLTPADKDAHCSPLCPGPCQHCWNNKKCQRTLEGPDGCNEQCLGCRKDPTECTLCRHYTHRGQCIPECPDNTVILQENQYCIKEEECHDLAGFVNNGKCLLGCPVGHIKQYNNVTKRTTCEKCVKGPEECGMICKNLKLISLGAIQQAERCVIVNGSLTIHVRDVPELMKELNTYLRKLQEVTDYILIYGCMTVTSLDFFSSLQKIGGRTLFKNSYSLVIRDMGKLKTLFGTEIAGNLTIGRGKLRAHGNPLLCRSRLDAISHLFPEKCNATDIPMGMNGYSGGCSNAPVDFTVRVINETAATLMFSPLTDSEMQYTVLYVRLPPGSRNAIVPETCSDSEWYALTVPPAGIVHLTSLRPASTYAVCIETLHTDLARSNIINFTTPAGKPAPPFITELVASASEDVTLRWTDHVDYRPHITHYELDVMLKEIADKDVTLRDHCLNEEIFEDRDYTRHAVVLKPPAEYNRGCESMCGILPNEAAGAIIEDYFDICSSLDYECDNYDEPRPANSTHGRFIRSAAINVRGPIKDYKVTGLAPYRDYKFRLRACIGDKCSRSVRETVRTLKSLQADIPKGTFYDANDIGHISVKWEPPDITNGPVLAYYVQVSRNIEDENILPQSWCVLPTEYSLVVKSDIVNMYWVRICATTLGSFNTCSDWKKILVPTVDYTTLWVGILFGLLFLLLLLVGSVLKYRLCKRKTERSDLILLVESTSMERNETEPPNVITLSDFTPLYNVPFQDRILNY